MKTNADSFFDFDIEPIRMRYLGSSSTRKTKQNQNFSHTSVKAFTQLTLAFFSLKEDEDLMTDNLKDETMFLKSLRDWHLNLEALR